MTRIILAAAAGFLLASPLSAQPAHVILIRHGEKPTDESDHGLSLPGKCRAAALVPYLLEKPEVKQLGRPAYIFAQLPPNSKKDSLRPVQTVQPFAAALNQHVLTPVTRDDYPKLVNDLLTNAKYTGKTVLVCWEHKKLADMAAALTASRTVAGAPKQWKWPGGEVFDRTWVISFTGKTTGAFHDYPQQLMYGDAKE